jgi:hypothetical protein
MHRTTCPSDARLHAVLIKNSPMQRRPSGAAVGIQAAQRRRAAAR